MRNPAPLSSTIRTRMQNTAQRDTQPERAVRALLETAGVVLIANRAPLPGMKSTADIVIPHSRVAVFLDGCFWHGCPEHGTLPTNNQVWWRDKIAANRRRDSRISTELEATGWIALRIWEHEDPSAAAQRIRKVVARRSARPDQARPRARRR
jgi:DNA mismatch endonuclease (patch repair protein)